MYFASEGGGSSKTVQNYCSTRTHKFFRCITPMEGKCLKRILKYFHCTEYNKINIYHSDIPKHFSYERYIKKIQIFYLQAHTKFFHTLRPTGEIF